jgi:Sigma-70, region 4
MYPRMITRSPVPVLAVVAGAPVLASVPPMAGCGRSPAARGVPVPAWVIGPLTAIARRAAGCHGDPHPRWVTAVGATGAKALAALPRRQRAAVVLRCIDDLQEAEIADMPGCGACMVNSQLSRGLARLRGPAAGQAEPGPAARGAHHR